MKRYRKMTTAQLDELLQKELRKDTPNEEVVLPILEILEKREKKPHRKNRWIISLATVAAVFALLISLLPNTAGANSFWGAVLHVADSVVQFFTPGEASGPTEAEYAFETDNPGLQQLYDKVVELGITAPVVPMWLPEEYELVEIKHIKFEGWEKLSAAFKKDDQTVLITYKICTDISSTQYEQLQNQIESYESGGYGHAITKNNQTWTAILIRTGLEGMITTNLTREELFKIVDSMYRRTWN